MATGRVTYISSGLDARPAASLPLVMAERLYRQATQRSLAATAREWLNGRPSRLLALDDVVDDLATFEGQPLGLQTVTVMEIAGSVEAARSQDFDAAFRPRHDHLKERWLSVAVRRQAGAGHRLPPVELVQLDERYFVVDGHHRVSVERALGNRTIEANVTMLTPKRSHEGAN